MTPEEKKAAVKTARIIRATRKLRGWTQVETAQKLGMSQSALSKIESAVLIPSVHQWFEFCTNAGIPADSHIQGYLDRLELIQFQPKITQSDFKLNEIYRKDAGSSARSLAPLVQWLYSAMGDVKAKKVIQEMGVDPDYFVDLGNPINFRFFVELFLFLKDKGANKKSSLAEVTSQISLQKTHGNLLAGYQQTANAESLLKTAFSQSKFYEVNFDYEIEESNNKKIVFSTQAKPHLLANKQLQFDEAREFLTDYRGWYFKNLLEQLKLNQVLVKNVSCVSNERDRSVFEMSYA